MADATIIQAQTAIAGRVAGESSLVVHGTIRGSIEIAETLTIGESGYVEGDVTADEIVVEGTVQGEVTARSRIVLTGTARAVATLHAPLLEMADGAQLKGEVNVGVDGEAPARSRSSSSASQSAASRTTATSRPVSTRTVTAAPAESAPSRSGAAAATSTTTTTTVTVVEEPAELAADETELSEELEGSVEEIREDYTVKELREELRRRDLAVSGTKDELIERLLHAQAEEADA